MFKHVHHVAYAVHNRDAMVDYLEKTFGMKPDYISDDQVYAKEAYYDIGETTIQITEPLDPKSEIGKYLAREGPGVFHVAWAVDDLKHLAQELAAKGVKTREKHGFQESPRGYITCNIDRTNSLGVWFQLAQGNPKRK